MNDENNIVISTKRFEELLMCQTELRALYALIHALDPYSSNEFTRKVEAFGESFNSINDKEGSNAE